MPAPDPTTQTLEPPGPRILIVDDEHVITDTLTLIFSHEGYQVRGVYSAEQALALLPAWLPHLALIDIRLPRMNGIDLAILLRAEYPDTRLLLFSGQTASAELLDQARLKGHTFEVLLKPIHPGELLATAARLTAAPPAFDA